MKNKKQDKLSEYLKLVYSVKQTWEEWARMKELKKELGL